MRLIRDKKNPKRWTLRLTKEESRRIVKELRTMIAPSVKGLAYVQFVCKPYEHATMYMDVEVR